MSQSVQNLLREAEARLAGHVDTPRLDAELLLCHTLERPRSWLFAWPEFTPDKRAIGRFHRLIGERCRGVPVAYLVGRREFWSLELTVTPEILVPRPETERLVELALERLAGVSGGTVADLGTGSGAIAIAIARERPDLRVFAVDRSAAACRVAAANARRLDARNVRVVRGDWAAALAPRSLHMVVANPPYVEAGDPALRRGALRHEPVEALAAGADGLEAIRALLPSVFRALRPGGWVLLEHGDRQGARVETLLREGGYLQVRDYTDLAGRPRVAAGRKASAKE